MLLSRVSGRLWPQRYTITNQIQLVVDCARFEVLIMKSNSTHASAGSDVFLANAVGELLQTATFNDHFQSRTDPRTPLLADYEACMILVRREKIPTCECKMAETVSYKTERYTKFE